MNNVGVAPTIAQASDEVLANVGLRSQHAAQFPNEHATLPDVCAAVQAAPDASVMDVPSPAPSLVAAIPAATEPVAPRIVLARTFPGGPQPAYAIALIHGLFFGCTVDLLDARELRTASLAKIGPHNRVFTANGRERILCTTAWFGVAASDTEPTPVAPILGPGYLSAALLVFRQSIPQWALSLRTAVALRLDRPGDAVSADAEPLTESGWLVEIAHQDDPMVPAPILVAAFNTSPEVALYLAAIDMAKLHPGFSARLSEVTPRLNQLLAFTTSAPPAAETP